MLCRFSSILLLTLNSCRIPHPNIYDVQSSTPPFIIIRNKYLGILLNDNLGWETHINNVIRKSQNSLQFVRILKKTSQITGELVYKKLVRPTLEYGFAFWDQYLEIPRRRLERVQKQAAMSYVDQDTEVIVTELGWESLDKMRQSVRLCQQVYCNNQIVTVLFTS